VALSLRRRELADSTGLPMDGLQAHLPAALVPEPARTQAALAHWQAQAQDGNPRSACSNWPPTSRRPRPTSTAAAPPTAPGGAAERSACAAAATTAVRATAASTPWWACSSACRCTPAAGAAPRRPKACAAQDQARAQVEATRSQVARHVHAAWLGLQVGAERVQALGQALQASEARLDATRTGLRWATAVLDLLNAENDTAATRLSLARRAAAWCWAPAPGRAGGPARRSRAAQRAVANPRSGAINAIKIIAACA
jgi:outer membrane protein